MDGLWNIPVAPVVEPPVHRKTVVYFNVPISEDIARIGKIEIEVLGGRENSASPPKNYSLWVFKGGTFPPDQCNETAAWTRVALGAELACPAASPRLAGLTGALDKNIVYYFNENADSNESNFARYGRRTH